MKIGIASLDAYKARTFAIARGERTPGKKEPKVWLRSTGSPASVLIEKNRALLTKIADQQLLAQEGLEPSTLDPPCA